jgi:hypothetical protein
MSRIMNSGAPAIAVITPTGNSDEPRTVRETVSAPTIMIAPPIKEKGTK